MADSDIKLKRKVQIRTKAEESEKPLQKETVELNTHTTQEKSKSKTWLWFLLGALIIGIIAYMVLSKSNNEPASSTEQQVVEAVEESPSTPDSVPTQVVPATSNDVADNDAIQSEHTDEVASKTDSNSDNTTSEITEASNISNDVETEAMRVIRGDYGVGQVRKNKLGSKYKPIQSRVNELKREGVF